MSDQELDSIFSVLENPIRRKILAKLAREQHYPLQLSKELNVSQQAIMKHLKVLEENDLVVSFEEKSTLGGPPRKCYVSKKRISLRIDVGPNTFSSDVFDYRELDETITEENNKKDRAETSLSMENQDKGTAEAKAIVFEKYVDEFVKSRDIEDPNKKLAELSSIIHKLDSELEDLKLKRSKFINLKEQVVRESNELISKLCQEYDERKILYYLLTHQDRNLVSISEAMEMRERVIEKIFKNLIKQHLLLIDEEEFYL